MCSCLQSYCIVMSSALMAARFWTTNAAKVAKGAKKAIFSFVVFARFALFVVQTPGGYLRSGPTTITIVASYTAATASTSATNT
jgi:hypothetical protein